MGIDEEQLEIGNRQRLAPAKLGSATRDSEERAHSPDKPEVSRTKSPEQKAHQIEALRRNSEASQMMVKRWTSKLSQDLPSLDITDILADSIKSSFIKRRQFAAEYSQSCYLTMLREE